MREAGGIALRWGRVAFLVTLVYAIVMTGTDDRYLFAGAAMFAIPAAVSFALLVSRLLPREKAISGAMVVLTGLLFASPGVGYAALKVWQRGLVPVRTADRQKYLLERIPGDDVLVLLNSTCGSHYTVYALFVEQSAFYADGRFLGDATGPYRYDTIRRLDDDPEALYTRLRKFGADHLLINERFARIAMPVSNPLFRARFRPMLISPSTELYELAP
ncbi:MAG: hypothetical protein ABI718_00370 [Acidobacteriota bacterium]